MLAGTEKPQRPGDHPKIDHARAVKKYHRPAAGNEAPLPEDVRPAPILRLTMDYLVGLVDQEWTRGGLGAFVQVQKFVRDRTRSIRQDATLQNLRVDLDSIQVHEQIARFHIICGHRLCELPKTDFDAFQNTEQLRKVLQSLAEFYVDLRAASQQSLPSEAEFRAFYLLTHLEDPDVFRKCFGWSAEVLASAPVQWALTAGAAFHQSDYITFFRLVSSPTSMDVRLKYLCCCLLHSHFGGMRLKAASVIAKAYAPGAELPASTLFDWLAFQDEAELVNWAEATGFSCNRSNGYLVSFVKPASVLDQPSTTVTLRRNDRLIEYLVSGIPISSIVKMTGSVQTVIPPQISLPKAPSNPLSKPVNLPTFKLPTEIASSAPVQAVNFVEEPVKPVPIVDLKPKIDFTDLSRKMLDNLMYSVCHEKLLEIATSVFRSHTEHQRLIQIASESLLDAFLHDEVKTVVSEVMEKSKNSRRRRIENLSNHIQSSLMFTVTQAILDDISVDIYQAALKERLRAAKPPVQNDPLESAYETGIRLPPSKPKLPSKRVRILAEEVDTTLPHSNSAQDLMQRLKEERESAEKFEAYLKSIKF